ncbi:hypothetical protein BGY98DRAFT_934059 [Russula aff. rugulosa BPL654]|nr:hypothetical protein BGY98DRAFT_934059 [Russula aff. rugulosa BPL654]
MTRQEAEANHWPTSKARSVALRPLARQNPQPCYRVNNVFPAISTSTIGGKDRATGRSHGSVTATGSYTPPRCHGDASLRTNTSAKSNAGTSGRGVKTETTKANRMEGSIALLLKTLSAVLRMPGVSPVFGGCGARGSAAVLWYVIAVAATVAAMAAYATRSQTARWVCLGGATRLSLSLGGALLEKEVGNTGATQVGKWCSDNILRSRGN